MKKITLKQTVVTGSLLAVFGYASSVAAHDITGSLGAAAGATDYYKVECFDDGAGPVDHLIAKIQDKAPVVAPMVSVRVTKDISPTSGIAKRTTDAVDGNAAYSPVLSVKGGNGEYHLIVDKTVAGAEIYNLQVHCETSTGQHTGTKEPVRLQNQ